MLTQVQKSQSASASLPLLCLLLAAAAVLSLLAPTALAANEAAASSDAVDYVAFGRRIAEQRLRQQQQQQQQQEEQQQSALEEAIARLLSRGQFQDAAKRALLEIQQQQQQQQPFLTVSSAAANNGSVVVNSACVNHTIALLKGLLRGAGWAIKFLDSDAKPPPAIGYGALLWLGNYDLCMAAGRAQPIKTADDGGRPLRGSYCLVSVAETGSAARANGGLQSSALRLGLCWPDSCSPEQVTNLTQLLLEPAQLLMPVNRSLLVVPGATQCHVPRGELPWTGGAVAMTCLLSLFLALILLGTAYDLASKYSVSSRMNSLLKSATDRQLLVNEAEDHGGADNSDTASAAAAAADSAVSNGNGGAAVANGNSAQAAGAAATLAGAGSATGAAKPHVLLRLLLCFSAYTNARKIVDVSHSDGTLTCIHGLRFLSMSWVILGHTYYFAFGSINNMAQMYQGWQNDWTFQVIANATVSVDSFFVLSGLLSTYLFFRELQRVGGRLGQVNWVMFYVHRYWRLTPPYLLVMATYVGLFQYAYEGPLYPQSASGIDPHCPTKWWQNALYVNNLITDNGGMGCMAWSWYLANDMQFYIISPLFFGLLAYKPALGIGAATALLLGSMTAMGVDSTVNGLNVGFLGIMQEFSGIYIKPWFRITPYLVGVLAGYLLHRLSARSWRPHRLLVAAGWLASAAVALAIVYGLYDVDGGRLVLPQGVASLYNAVYRPAWAAAVAWVTIACVTGHGGWVNSFLSQPLFAPLSRLTYCAYLVHPVVMMAYYLSRRQPLVWDNFSVVHAFLGNSMLAYMAAFLASLAFEAPLIGLEKVLRGR